MFGDDMDTDHGNGYFQFPGGGGGPRRPPAPKKVEIPLNLTLEELYQGCTKRRKVTKRIVDAASNKSMPVEEVLEIKVKAGWKEGTRITFEGKGDELPGQPPQDLVFIIHQLPHTKFHRSGNDLVTRMRIPLHMALAADKSVNVPTLNPNRTLKVPLKEAVTPGYERVVKGEGMPISKTPGTKGDLLIKFEVQFPKEQLQGADAAALERVLAGKY